MLRIAEDEMAEMARQIGAAHVKVRLPTDYFVLDAPDRGIAMAISYRVIDLRPGALEAFDIVVEGVSSPEQAVRQALHVDVVRSGHERDVVACVHWQMLGQPTNMVRLYKAITTAR